MLDGAGDAHGDVQLRSDDLAGLANLHVAGHVAGIHRRARGTDGGAELVGQLVDHLEVLFRADAAATGDHAPGALQVRAVALAGGQADEAGVRGQGGIDVDGLDRCAVALGCFRPRSGANGRHHDLVGRQFHGDDALPA